MAGGPKDDDDDLFREAMAGVDRLPRQSRVPAGGGPRPRLSVSERPELVVHGRSARAAGVNDQRMHDLESGRIPPEAEVDLHRQTAEVARATVARAVTEAQAAGLRCLLVIHGRGRHTAGQSVLRDEAIDELARGHARGRVLALCPASPAHGGDGAMYVLLRRRKR